MHINVQRRLVKLTICCIFLSLGVSLILLSLKNHITLYYTPKQLNSTFSSANITKKITLGGLVKQNSIYKLSNNYITFILSDTDNSEIPIIFSGAVPMIFRENQGAILKGKVYSPNYLIKYINQTNKSVSPKSQAIVGIPNLPHMFDKLKMYLNNLKFDKIFVAEQLIVKHDEKYYPPDT